MTDKAKERDSFARLSSGFWMGRYHADRVAKMHASEFGEKLAVRKVPGTGFYYRLGRPDSYYEAAVGTITA